jgi:hypothetical protein
LSGYPKSFRIVLVTPQMNRKSSTYPTFSRGYGVVT